MPEKGAVLQEEFETEVGTAVTERNALARTRDVLDGIERQDQADTRIAAGQPMALAKTSGVMDQIDEGHRTAVTTPPEESHGVSLIRSAVDGIQEDAEVKANDYSLGKPRRVIVRGRVIHD